MATLALSGGTAAAAAGRLGAVSSSKKVTSASSLSPSATLDISPFTPRLATPRGAAIVPARHSKLSSKTRLAASKFQKISVSDDAEDSSSSPDAVTETETETETAGATTTTTGVNVNAADGEKPKLEILGLANEDGTLKFDDDELPDNLFDAVATAATATEEAISNGSLGNLVELRIPELWDPISGNVMAEAGDQLKVWELTREYTAQLCERMGPDARVKAVFPDAGCSAMLKARWPDAPFVIASSNDRKLYEDGDAVLVFAAPDPPSLEAVQQTTKIANEDGAAVVLVNPRLASGDAGIGLTVRRMREEFLGRMTVVYCIQPLDWCNGNIFKRYPGMWRLYLQDEERPGRFKLVQESYQRLAGDDLDDVVMQQFRPKGEDGEEIEAGPVEKVFRVVADMQRFMRSLSN